MNRKHKKMNILDLIVCTWYAFWIKLFIEKSGK